MPDIPRSVSRRTSIRRGGGSAIVRDRSTAYRRLCAAILDAEPLCRYCRASGRISAATVVDHIVALSLGGSNDHSNLAPACTGCNADKAKVEQRCAAKGYSWQDAILDYELADWIRFARALEARS